MVDTRFGDSAARRSPGARPVARLISRSPSGPTCAPIASMGLDESTIDAAVERYRRETDRYAKLVDLVASACRELIRDNADPCHRPVAREGPGSASQQASQVPRQLRQIEDVFEGLKTSPACGLRRTSRAIESACPPRSCKRFEAPGWREVEPVVKDSAVRSIGLHTVKSLSWPRTSDPGTKTCKEIAARSRSAACWRTSGTKSSTTGVQASVGELSAGETRALSARQSYPCRDSTI